MTKYTYIYQGESVVSIPNVGICSPGQVIETDVEINNPLFILKVEDKKKGK